MLLLCTTHWPPILLPRLPIFPPCFPAALHKLKAKEQIAQLPACHPAVPAPTLCILLPSLPLFLPLQELKAKEQIAQLKIEISGLTKVLEAGAAVGLAEEADLAELIRQKEEVAAERDAQVDTIAALRNEVSGRVAGTGGSACVCMDGAQVQVQAATCSLWEGCIVQRQCSTGGSYSNHNPPTLPACSAGFYHPLPPPPHPGQVMDFAEHMRAAEAEKAGLEAEIQVGGRRGEEWRGAMVGWAGGAVQGAAYLQWQLQG